MNKIMKRMLALIAGLILVVSLSAPASHAGENFKQVKSSYCVMPCCVQAKIDKTSCCCFELPNPGNHNVPAGGSTTNTGNFVDLLVLEQDNWPSTTLLSLKNMVGWSSGFEKGAPPPVKLFILNESFLC